LILLPLQMSFYAWEYFYDCNVNDSGQDCGPGDESEHSVGFHITEIKHFESAKNQG